MGKREGKRSKWKHCCDCFLTHVLIFHLNHKSQDNFYYSGMYAERRAIYKTNLLQLFFFFFFFFFLFPSQNNGNVSQHSSYPFWMTIKWRWREENFVGRTLCALDKNQLLSSWYLKIFTLNLTFFILWEDCGCINLLG